MKFILL